MLYDHIPGFALFKDQERILVVFAVAIGVLSAFGYQSLVEASRSRWGWSWPLYIVSGLLIAVGGILAWIKAPELIQNPAVWSSWVRFAVFIVITLVLLVFGDMEN